MLLKTIEDGSEILVKPGKNNHSDCRALKEEWGDSTIILKHESKRMQCSLKEAIREITTLDKEATLTILKSACNMTKQLDAVSEGFQRLLDMRHADIFWQFMKGTDSTGTVFGKREVLYMVRARILYAKCATNRDLEVSDMRMRKLCDKFLDKKFPKRFIVKVPEQADIHKGRVKAQVQKLIENTDMEEIYKEQVKMSVVVVYTARQTIKQILAQESKRAREAKQQHPPICK